MPGGQNCDDFWSRMYTHLVNLHMTMLFWYATILNVNGQCIEYSCKCIEYDSCKRILWLCKCIECNMQMFRMFSYANVSKIQISRANVSNLICKCTECLCQCIEDDMQMYANVSKILFSYSNVSNMICECIECLCQWIEDGMQMYWMFKQMHQIVSYAYVCCNMQMYQKICFHMQVYRICKPTNIPEGCAREPKQRRPQAPWLAPPHPPQ